MIPPLIVRADAGPGIGLGHLVRSVALAQEWQDRGGQVVLATSVDPEGIPASMVIDGMALVRIPHKHPDPSDLATTERIVKTHTSPWVVCDGYTLDADYTRGLDRAGARVLVIDDQAHAPHYHAHVLLNQNLGAERLRYRFDRRTTTLLGPRFVLLSRQYAPWRSWSRTTPTQAKCCLISLGGGAATGVLDLIVGACRRFAGSGLRVIVMTGPSGEVAPSTAAAAQAAGGVVIEWVTNHPDVPALMASADIAVSAAGSTVWQLCFMGVPAALLTLVDNQAGIADCLERAGCAVNLGWHADLDEAKVGAALEHMIGSSSTRAMMSERARALVDGAGAKRVVDALLNPQAASQ